MRFKKDLGNREHFDFIDDLAVDHDPHAESYDADANSEIVRYLDDMETLDRCWRIPELPRLH